MIRYLGGVERAPESSSLLQNTELYLSAQTLFQSRALRAGGPAGPQGLGCGWVWLVDPLLQAIALEEV